MTADVYGPQRAHHKWMLRFQLSVYIALCTIVFDRARECAAESDNSCPSPRLLVALSGQGRYPAADEELWSDAELLAYDLMTKASVVGMWQEPKLNELTISVGDALQRLHLAFPETRVFPTLEYRKLALQVRFVNEIQDRLEALLPPPRPNAVRLVRLPGPFSEAVSSFCERLCECWVQVDTDATARMYFPKSVNLRHAMRQLRSFPDVTSAGLMKTAPPHLTTESPSWQNLSVQDVGGDYYFTLTTLRLEQKTETKYYIVTSSQVRVLDASEAAKMIESQSSSLPADAWP